MFETPNSNLNPILLKPQASALDLNHINPKTVLGSSLAPWLRYTPECRDCTPAGTKSSNQASFKGLIGYL